MSHDATIPRDLHAETRTELKEALGAFWSTVFTDQDLLDTELSARVLSAAQAYLDAMEALALRDHRTSPVFHREHWHPLLIRLSQRNAGRGLAMGMADTPVIGPQACPDGEDCPLADAYLPGEVFEVGGNADYSKVRTYPFTAMLGCPLVNVRTCICDSIAAPSHLLLQDRDFAISDGVLTIRKEQDPFEVGGYRILDDGTDRVAVLWVCDGEFDTNNVGDFLGYPMGFDVRSTPEAARMLSAYWDAVVYGLAPRYLNAVLGAVFGVETVREDCTVEYLKTPSDGWHEIVTDKAVYHVPSGRLLPSVTAGAVLKAGTFLTDELEVYHSLSPDEVAELIDSGTLGGLSFPPGHIAGVGSTVVLESFDSPFEADGGWFRLNTGDTADSPFWTAVRARTTYAERQALFDRLAGGAGTVNPMKALGYLALANTVLIRTDRGLCADPAAPLVFAAFVRLIPAYASLLAVQTVGLEDALAAGSDALGDPVCVNRTSTSTSGLAAATDRVSFAFVPVAATEV